MFGDPGAAYALLRAQAAAQGEWEDEHVDTRDPAETARRLLHTARRGDLPHGTKYASMAAAYASLGVCVRLDELIRLFTEPAPDPGTVAAGTSDTPVTRGENMSIFDEIATELKPLLTRAEGIPADIANTVQRVLDKIKGAAVAGAQEVAEEAGPVVVNAAETAAADTEAAVKTEAPVVEAAVEEGAQEVAAAVEAPAAPAAPETPAPSA